MVNSCVKLIWHSNDIDTDLFNDSSPYGGPVKQLKQISAVQISHIFHFTEMTTYINFIQILSHAKIQRFYFHARKIDSYLIQNFQHLHFRTKVSKTFNAFNSSFTEYNFYNGRVICGRCTNYDRRRFIINVYCILDLYMTASTLNEVRFTWLNLNTAQYQCKVFFSILMDADSNEERQINVF